MNARHADVGEDLGVRAERGCRYQRFARDGEIAGASSDDHNAANRRVKFSSRQPKRARDAVLLSGGESFGQVGGLLVADPRRQAMLFRVHEKLAGRPLRSIRCVLPWQ